eukprot:gb/GECH01012192.1/.p1 GENE.gb/GECH01012192.1/~~gb/GECH01012192.1/.p1  ORF type:complete len:649 (+),score=162.91 gb/GECH01012192.1/:1-1947(+)
MDKHQVLVLWDATQCRIPNMPPIDIIKTIRENITSRSSFKENTIIKPIQIFGDWSHGLKELKPEFHNLGAILTDVMQNSSSNTEMFNSLLRFCLEHQCGAEATVALLTNSKEFFTAINILKNYNIQVVLFHTDNRIDNRFRTLLGDDNIIHWYSLWDYPHRHDNEPYRSIPMDNPPPMNRSRSPSNRRFRHGESYPPVPTCFEPLIIAFKRLCSKGRYVVSIPRLAKFVKSDLAKWGYNDIETYVEDALKANVVYEYLREEKTVEIYKRFITKPNTIEYVDSDFRRKDRGRSSSRGRGGSYSHREDDYSRRHPRDYDASNDRRNSHDEIDNEFKRELLDKYQQELELMESILSEFKQEMILPHQYEVRKELSKQAKKKISNAMWEDICTAAKADDFQFIEPNIWPRSGAYRYYEPKSKDLTQDHLDELKSNLSPIKERSFSDLKDLARFLKHDSGMNYPLGQIEALCIKAQERSWIKENENGSVSISSSLGYRTIKRAQKSNDELNSSPSEKPSNATNSIETEGSTERRNFDASGLDSFMGPEETDFAFGEFGAEPWGKNNDDAQNEVSQSEETQSKHVSPPKEEENDIDNPDSWISSAPPPSEPVDGLNDHNDNDNFNDKRNGSQRSNYHHHNYRHHHHHHRSHQNH